MHTDILNFIKKQTCATIACAGANAQPYCFACFYTFDADNVILFYKSSKETNHSRLLEKNSNVAGTIHPDKLNKLLVQGIQFEGVALAPSHPLAKNAFSIYHKRHPLAIVKPGELWAIQLNHVKMTDSTKGFGTKLEWRR